MYMYNLKLTSEELGALRIALVMAQNAFKENPEFFADELSDVEILYQKAKNAEFVYEEG